MFEVDKYYTTFVTNIAVPEKAITDSSILPKQRLIPNIWLVMLKKADECKPFYAGTILAV